MQSVTYVCILRIYVQICPFMIKRNYNGMIYTFIYTCMYMNVFYVCQCISYFLLSFYLLTIHIVSSFATIAQNKLIPIYLQHEIFNSFTLLS